MDAAARFHPLGLWRHQPSRKAVMVVVSTIFFCLSIYNIINPQSVEASCSGKTDLDPLSYMQLEGIPIIPEVFKRPARKLWTQGRRLQKFASFTGVSGNGKTVAKALYSKWGEATKRALLMSPDVFAADLYDIMASLEVPRKMRNHPRALWNFLHDIAYVLGEDNRVQKQLRVTGGMARFVGILYWWLLRSNIDADHSEFSNVKPQYIVATQKILHDDGLGCYGAPSIGKGGVLTTIFYNVVACGFSSSLRSTKNKLSRLSRIEHHILLSAREWEKAGRRHEDNISETGGEYTEEHSTPGVREGVRAAMKTSRLFGYSTAFRLHCLNELDDFLGPVEPTISEIGEHVMDYCFGESPDAKYEANIVELQREIAALRRKPVCPSPNENDYAASNDEMEKHLGPENLNINDHIPSLIERTK